MIQDYSFIDSSDKTIRKVLKAILCKDLFIWESDIGDPLDFLGWVDAPRETFNKLSNMALSVPDLQEEFELVVLLGFGGSSLSARTLTDVYGDISGLEFYYLDSTVPEQIEDLQKSIDLAKTLFLVSSKSGSTFETMHLFKYFFRKVSELSGNLHAGDQFIAITDKGSPLDILAAKHKFRMVLHGHPGVGGRYSVFTPFGIFPGLLAGVPIESVLEGALSASNSVVRSDEFANMEKLLTFLLKGLKGGRDKLFVYTDEGLEGMGLWIEQMLAESLGKSGVGVIPVIRSHTDYSIKERQDSMAVSISFNEKSSGESTSSVYSLVIDSPFSLGYQLYVWSVITAAFGKLLGVNPFNQPHVESSKKAMAEILESDGGGQEIAWDEQMVSASNLLKNVSCGEYIGILCYLPRTAKVLRLTKVLANRIEKETGLVCTLHLGPAYLHSVGQLHKGGPQSGKFLMIGQSFSVGYSSLSGDAYDFERILEAQFNGDFQALNSYNRKVSRILFDDGIEKGFSKMFKDLDLKLDCG